MKFKKLKVCFKTSEIELNSDYSNYWYILLDRSRTYYGISFAIDLDKLHYGNIVCENTGVEYKSYYKIRKFFRFTFYHYCKHWKEKGWKPRWLNLSVQEAKKKV